MAIGYACVTIGVPGTSISSCTLKNATKENIRSLIQKNLSALEKMLDYNIRNGIQLFRISSDLIPFGSHPVNTIDWCREYRDTFEELEVKIKKAGMRVSMHPGQYTVINSGDPSVVERSVEELLYHARFLDALGMDCKHKIILHIGGVYGNKEQAMKNFVHRYRGLPQAVTSRLVIENDERSYNIAEVLQISEECGAPVVFDNLHHMINSPAKELSDEEWIKLCSLTWNKGDGRQKIHYSQQKEQSQPGRHSDTIYLRPFIEYFNHFTEITFDIMLEVKDKNLSTMKCNHAILHPSTASQLKEEWARYQYYVLSKDGKAYQAISDLLRDGESQVALQFYEMIEDTISLPENLDEQTNAAQHLWVNLIADCTTAERNRYDRLMKDYRTGKSPITPLKNHLYRCAVAQNQEHLTQSLYFFL